MKKITLIILLLFLVISCGRKGPPVYNDPADETKKNYGKKKKKIV